MDPVQALLIGVLAPGAAAAALVLVLRRRTGGADLAPPWAAALALATAYALAFALILGWPSLPPVDVTQLSPWLGLFAAPIALVPRTTRRGLVASGALSLALGAAAGALLVSPLTGRALGDLDAALLIAAIAASFALFDLSLARALGPLDPRGGAATVATLAGATAAAILLSDTASLGQTTGALAAAAGALLTLGLWRPGLADLRAATPVLAAVLASNLWSAALYASALPAVVALLLLSPLALLAARRLLSRPRPALYAIALPVLVALVPAGVALALAAETYCPEPAASPPAAVSPGGASPATPAAEGYDPNYGY